MKKILLMLGIMILSGTSYLQAQVGIGTTSPDNSATLDLTSTSKGILIPRMTTTQRSAISSPATGLMVYDNTLNSFYYYNGAAWIQVASGGTSPWSVTGSNIQNSNSGAVGIGKAPSYKLDVLGPVSADSFVINGTRILSTKGSNNIFLGSRSGLKNSSSDNTFLGYASGYGNTMGGENNFIGSYSGYYNTTGFYNNFNGAGTGFFNTTGFSNNFTGALAGQSNTTGNNNSFSGYAAGYYNKAGSNILADGNQALYYNKMSGNTAVGAWSGFSNTIGSQNVFVGDSAGFYNTTGNQNSFTGYQAGYTNTTGLNNTYLGYSAKGTATLKNATAIGANASVAASNALVLGNGARVGIGTSAPGAKIEVNGSVKLDTLAGTGSRMVVTDANGLLSTQSITTYTGSNGVIITGGSVQLGGNLSGATTIGTTLTNTLKVTGVQSGSSSDSLMVISTGVIKKIAPYTGANGLSIAGNTVKLGGSLTGATTIGTTSTNTLKVTGVQSGASTDSFMVLSNGVVKKVAPSSLNPWATSGSNIQNSNTGDVGIGKVPASGLDVKKSINTDSAYKYKGSVIYSQKGTSNVFIGPGSGIHVTTSLQNVFIGDSAGYSETTGNALGSNTYVGWQAGYTNSTGYNNSFYGWASGNKNTSGTDNTFLGNDAGYSNTTGSSNVHIGSFAGLSNTIGSHNTLIGTYANVDYGNLSNATAIGYNATVHQSNSLVLGSGANVGIGTSSPGAKLDVVNGNMGTIRALSGISSSVTSIQVGRTTGEGEIGIAAGTGNFSTDASAGDVVIRTLSASQKLILNSGAGASGLAVNGTSLGMGTVTPAASSILEIKSTTKGILIPRMTSTQRTAISTPDSGLQVYDKTLNAFYYYNGLAWVPIISGINPWTTIGSNISNNNSGNVGIGKSPSYELDVLGAVNADSFMISGNPVVNTKGTGNLLLGAGAGTRNTGSNNSFTGSQAGYSNTTGGNNNFTGSYSGYYNTTGNNNSFTGYQAGYKNTTGIQNSFAGAISGYSNTTGSNNSFTGNLSGLSNTTGNNNSFTGNSSGFSNSKGANIVAEGSFSLYNNIKGGNTAIGSYSGYNSTTGTNNFLGGDSAAYNNTSGSGITAIGYQAGLSNTTGSNNTYLGYGANGSATLTNATALGYNSSVTQSNSLVLGNGANVGIGISNPSDKLHIDPAGAGGISIGTNGGSGGYTMLSLGISASSNGYSTIQSIKSAGSSWGNIIMNASGGNVGIGKSTAIHGLDVSNGISTDSAMRFTGSGDTTAANEIFFNNNGQIRSADNNHRIIFDRNSQILELREYGDILFSPGSGATSSGRTQKMTIKSGGNVGMGISAPLFPLEIYNAKTDVMRLSNSTGGSGNKTSIAFNTYSSTAAVVARVTAIDGGSFNGALAFEVNGNTTAHNATTTEAMRISTAGNVSIGTTTANGKLTVAGNVAPSADNSYSNGTSGDRWSVVYAANGTIQTSDRRLKENILGLSYGLAEVLKLHPVSYTWIKNPEQGKKVGLIAQEVQKIVPEVVKVGDDSLKTLGMNYAELVPVLINAIQEQQKIIENQKAGMQKQETRLEQLSAQISEIRALLQPAINKIPISASIK